MLPKRMPEQSMDDVTQTHHNGTEHTSEPHVVVACPSCRTKFAVESSLIAAYEVPRFHCSRCDSIFDLNPQRPTPPAPSSSPSQRWILEDSSHKSPRNTDTGSSPTTPTAKAPLKSTDFTLGTVPSPDSLEPRAPFDPIDDRAGVSLLGFQPTRSRRQSTSLTRSEAQALVAGMQPAPDASPATPPHRSAATEDRHDPFALFDTPGAPPAQRDTPTQPIARATPSAPAAEESPPPKRSESTAPRTKPEAAPHLQPPVAAHPPISEPRPSLLSRLSERTQGLVRLSIPVLAALVVLFVITVATRIMPLTMDSVIGAIVPGFVAGKTTHLPPAELTVQALSLQVERLQSKETIPVIRGFVHNASDTSFEDVSIEALGFNARGELLVRARAPLRSALSREKISDLPLETVKRFQHALSASDSSIKAGEKVAFSVALFLQDAAADEVTYFSARVFSVGRSR